MRIVHVISSLGVGGAENVAVELAIQHAPQHDVHVQAVRRADPGESAVADKRRSTLTAAGVSWSEGRAPGQRTAPMIAPFELASRITRFKPDIVHSHTDVPDLCVALAGYLSRFRLARTIHNTHLWPNRRRIGRFAERRFRDDLVVAINPPTLDAYHALRADLGLASSRNLRVISNGVRRMAKDEYFSRDDLVRVMGADPRRKQIGFIGRLDMQKGFDVLLEAVSGMVATGGEEMQLHIIGDGALRERAVAAAGSEGVSWHGAMPEARRWLRAFDLIVMPSRFEGQPLVAMEAIMAGVPLLATDVPGLGDVLPPGWPGRLAAAEPDVLRAALEAFRDGRLGFPAYPADWADQFDATAMAQDYQRAYAEFLLNPPAVDAATVRGASPPRAAA